jgi:6-phosphogluconolactonase
MPASSFPDGRTIVTFDDDKAMSAELVKQVTATLDAAIKAKGSAALCIPAGSVVSALKALDPAALDWTKVNVFFTGERLGQNKSYSAALESFCNKCKVSNVFFPLVRPLFSTGGPLPQFAVDEAAAAYTALLKSHPSIDNSGPMPSFDLLLLGVGEDGHCGSLHPKSNEIKGTGKGTVTFGICKEGKNQIAISMDVMCASKKVILASTGAKKADAVKMAVGGAFEEFNCPAALVKTKDIANTIWYVDKASNP